MTERKTTTPQKALRIRERAKRKKPEFARHESWRYTRLKENWRRPRGLDNKMRRKIKGWPPMVSTGYRGPKVARGMHPSGYKEVLVYNADEIKKVDPKTEAVRIAHAVGKRKRMRILIEARRKKVVVLNFRQVKEAAEEVEEKKEEAGEEKEWEAVEEEKRPKGARKRKPKKELKSSDES